MDTREHGRVEGKKQQENCGCLLWMTPTESGRMVVDGCAVKFCIEWPNE